MTREKAIETMDRLGAAGYTVQLIAIPQRSHVDPRNPNPDGRMYRVDVIELGVDKVDLRALVEIADELELDVGMHVLTNGNVSFSALATTPEVVRNPRWHPLAAKDGE